MTDELLAEIRLLLPAVASQFDEWKMERESRGHWYPYNQEIREKLTDLMRRIDAFAKDGTVADDR